jgi:hypothetical protein
MIELRVRFWTDSIADGKGKIIPKHAWDAGVVHIQSNAAHGLAPDPKPPTPFNSLAELPAKIEQVLIANGVKLHLGSRSRKYLEP